MPVANNRGGYCFNFCGMKRGVWIGVIFCICFVPHGYSQDLDQYFSQVNSFLSSYVQNGRVDYESIADRFDEAKDIYEAQCQLDLGNVSKEAKKAFFINAYNMIVIYQVAKYYEFNQQSPMDQSGFFDKIKHKVAGEMLTLNQLEIKKLLMTYKDARIHFVLACAAKSCPPLAEFAYEPGQLESQLEKRTRLAINDNDWLRLKNGERKVEISKIFDWYKRDFTTSGTTLLEYINQYREMPIPNNYAVEFYEYDWSLNGG